MSVYFQDHDITLHLGDVRDVLASLPAESVNCVVTSPPYYGLRDYGMDGQIGLEPSPAEYVEQMRAVFADVRRVLRSDGVLWLNLGDSYSSPVMHNDNAHNANRDGSSDAKARAMGDAMGRVKRPMTLPAKNLLGVPWRVAFALQDDGWTLRNAVVWHKPNAMPESVTDRLSTRYEHVFLFSKSRRYWFDLDPIRDDHITADRPLTVGRNPGDVWSITTQPFAGAHFATMPRELVRRCIEAGCPTDGTVLDPFAGSGTTLMVARQLGSKSVGIELNPDYCAIAVDRIGDPVFDFAGGGA